MKQGEVEEIRGQIKLILKNITPPKPNISKEEIKAIKELRRDQEKVILTAHKGVSMVVMEKKECIKKSEDLLNQSTYIALTTDLINKCKNNLIKSAQDHKSRRGHREQHLQEAIPHSGSTTQILWSAQNTQEGHTAQAHNIQQGLSHIWDSKGTGKDSKAPHRKVTHHVYNNKDFLESIKDIKVEDECIMSCDVSTLFTSIPIDTTINIIKKQLEDDKDLHSRTNMTIKHICCLLEFCLKNTYFNFNGEFYEQKEGAAMGSPISPIVANLFMEDLKIKAIRTSTTPPKIWTRIVDDTFTIIKKENRNSFLQHLNFIHPNIKFTCEEVREDGSMPFLDILVIPAEDGSLKTSVFRKPTHTDLYLQWDIHHNIPSKYSVAGTLYHRATTICSNPTLL